MNARHLATALHAAGAISALVLLAGPALADTGNGTYDCTYSEAANTSNNPSFVTCSINWNSGAVAPQTPPPAPALVPATSGLPDAYGNFYYAGQSTPTGSGGPFEFDFLTTTPEYTSGTLTLTNPQSSPFVIALASNDTYSLFLYDPAGGVPVTQVSFDTIGTTGVSGSYSLQYANLYTQAIPEPSTYALMLVGLAATGLALRRRKA